MSSFNHRRLANELELLKLAIGFLTRLPMPACVDYSTEKMHQCTRYFPLVGGLLGLILISLFWLSEPWLGNNLAVFLLLISSLLLTGALHEDGLADTCDGFGGGQSPKHKLEIMKDSRIGTYGTCALTCSLLGKYLLLRELADIGWLEKSIVIAYPLSRALALSHVQDLVYVSTVNSKSDPLAKPMDRGHLTFVLISGALGLVLLPLLQALALILACLALRVYFKRLMHSHIGGFTGDCLGAAQQMQELLIYLMLLILLGSTGKEL